jgi:uncharacterized protein YqeY
MKTALRGGAKLELSALRMALAAIQTKTIEARAPLGDAAVLSVLEKLIKQGRDSQSQFADAGRTELAAKEAAEIEVLQRYLPQALSSDELEALIRSAIQSSGADGIKDMGKVMAAVKAQAAGRADMAAVSSRVREILTGQ